MFPLKKSVATSTSPLAKLRTIKLIASTKKNSELQYVFQNVSNFLRDIPDETQIYWLQVILIHKSTHLLFQELVLIALMFLQKHAESVRYVNLTFRDAQQQQQPKQQAPPPKDKINISPPQQQEKTGEIAAYETTPPEVPMRKGTLLPGVVITPHQKDIHVEVATSDNREAESESESEGEANVEPEPIATRKSVEEDDDGEQVNDKIIAARNYLASHPWPEARKLEYLILNLPYRQLKLMINIMTPAAQLNTLNLEANRGPSHLYWQLYEDFLRRGNTSNLKYVTFNNINVEDDKRGRALPVDFKIFKKSKNLKKLSLTFEKKEDLMDLSRATNVSMLPRSLQEVTLERLLLTAGQVSRLLFCYPRLKTLSISYWSLSNCQFALLMRILKWMVKFEMTDVNTINLVDTKIRFHNKRKVVRQLQEAVAVSARYEDMDETKLIINKDLMPDHLSFAPHLTVQKKMPLHPKPKRKIDPSQSLLSIPSEPLLK